VKVTGEVFSKKRKGAEEIRYKKVLKLKAKGTVTDRTLESFIKEAPTRNPYELGKPLQSMPKNCVLIFSI